MVNWVSPAYSKKRVSRAGHAIGNGAADAEDLHAVANWRASHAYILNTFQSNLRQRTKNTQSVVGTRLKRLPTIENKLKRFPEMQLSRMHDIAGCRVIFESLPELIDFRENFHKARFNHKRRGAEGNGKWNYISDPKADGYRGIHEVYEYDVRSEGGKAWNGLNVEIQLRTGIQHSWSTAVEVAGLLTKNTPKFGEGDERIVQQFRIASELLARNFESTNSCLPDVNINILKRDFIELENQTRMIELFRRVNLKVVDIDFRKNNILIFPFVPEEDENKNKLEIYSFSNVFLAIKKYEEFEKFYNETADVVLVRADSFENIKYTFRNYFADTRDFVNLIDICLT